MIPKGPEQARFLDIPVISKKTSSQQLKIWSEEHWPSEGGTTVANDIVKNGRELLVATNTNWDQVLKSIRNGVQLGGVQSGYGAIARNDAITIGGLGGVANWSMNRPPMVYLSAICLANRVKRGGELEYFKSRIRQAATMYMYKTFPDAVKYVKTLDFLLEVKNRDKYRKVIKRTQTLLGSGEIGEAYRTVIERGDLLRRSA